MAQVSTAIEGGRLVLSAEGFGQVSAPLEARTGETAEGTVWDWTGPVDLVDPEVDRWTSEVLEMPCRLVAMGEDFDRQRLSCEIAFPDAAPVLVAGEASLQALNSTLEEPVPMDRFRANVILRGTEPYAEDTWSGFKVGGARFEFVKRCGRCLVTTADQETGERHPGEEPLRTLARDRRFEKAACFGAYYRPAGEGRVEAGDPILDFGF